MLSSALLKLHTLNIASASNTYSAQESLCSSPLWRIEKIDDRAESVIDVRLRSLILISLIIV